MIVGPLFLPATVIFLGLVAGAILLVMSWVLGGEHDHSEDALASACPRCRHLNPTHARYCARCGRALA
jgi:hypothetical protein